MALIIRTQWLNYNFTENKSLKIQNDNLCVSEGIHLTILDAWLYSFSESESHWYYGKSFLRYFRPKGYGWFYNIVKKKDATELDDIFF